MTTGRITLQTWLRETYRDGEGPGLNTARAWCKAGKLEPPAVKEGRTWYVDPGARYTPHRHAKPKRRLLERILDGETKEARAPHAT